MIVSYDDLWQVLPTGIHYYNTLIEDLRSLTPGCRATLIHTLYYTSSSSCIIRALPPNSLYRVHSVKLNHLFVRLACNLS